MVRGVLRGVILYAAGYLGGWAGMLLAAVLLIAPAADRQRAERPGETVCGTPFVPILLLGGLLGGAAGAGCGWWIGGRVFPRPAPPQHSSTGT